MTDREKILRGAECCKYEPSANGCPEECPYLPEGHLTCGLDPFLSDVIELLKEQEPIVIHKNIVDEIYDYIACCPECDMTWAMWHPEKMRFCPGCGKPVKWE